MGRIVKPPSDLALEDVVREALFLSQGRLAARGVRVDVATGLPHVWGDRARLVQVMQNLVENAVKFMGDQPEPRITIGQRAAPPGQPPVLFVRDNGIGIPQKQRDTIFTLFRKLDPHAEGTGIGLALVRRIVEAHGRPRLGGVGGTGRARPSASPCRRNRWVKTPAAEPEAGARGSSTMGPGLLSRKTARSDSKYHSRRPWS